jgi:hypothetical protein
MDSPMELEEVSSKHPEGKLGQVERNVEIKSDS